MMLYSGKEKTIYLKTETNKFGIAIQASDIINLKFDLLKSTVHLTLTRFSV